MNDETLFHLALERPASERPAFLEQACAGDDALRQRLEDLLRSHETPDSFLVRPAENLEGTLDSGPSRMAELDAPGSPRDPAVGRGSPAGSPGSRIGPYKPIQQIGEGGMGTVFMAEQTEPVKRLVALKLIRAEIGRAHV